MSLSHKHTALLGILLALCVASQLIRAAGPFATGTAVNLAIFIASLFIGPRAGILLGLITPLTSFALTGSPQFPIAIPGIMAGNAALAAVCGAICGRGPSPVRLAAGLVAAAVCKAALMGLIFIFVLIPIMIGGMPEGGREAAATAMTLSFSVVQLVTAGAAGAVVFALYGRLSSAVGRLRG